jgi:signal peptidase II
MKKWLLVALVAGCVFGSDQLTKFLAVVHLTSAMRVAGAEGLGAELQAFVQQKDLLERGMANPPSVVIGSVWQHRYTQNRGAAWGVLSGARAGFRVPFFHLVTIAAVIFLGLYVRKLEETQRYLQVAAALLLGGALGNGLDRALRGYVIDFIDWHWFDPNWLQPSHHWPTFNVADCGVSIGLALLFLDMFFASKEPAQKPAAPHPEGA